MTKLTTFDTRLKMLLSFMQNVKIDALAYNKDAPNTNPPLRVRRGVRVFIDYCVSLIFSRLVRLSLPTLKALVALLPPEETHVFVIVPGLPLFPGV